MGTVERLRGEVVVLTAECETQQKWIEGGGSGQ